MHRFLLLLLPFTAAAQDKGMQFEHGLSWSAIQAKARAENKYIFVDCYTTWCGPCKFMATTVFPTAEAGSFFNDKFLNVAVQLDTSAKDNAETKTWYADAHALMTGYHINAFPTYLIFAPDGRPLHRLVGSNPVVKSFIEQVRQSFDTTKQYYTAIQQFHDGRRDSAFLRRLALEANSLSDNHEGSPIAEAYYASQPDLYTHGALEVLMDYTGSTTDKGFSILSGNTARVDSVMGAGIAEDHLNGILVQKFVWPLIHATGDPNWKKVQSAIAAGYPAQAEEVTLRTKLFFYEYKEDWSHFQPAIVEYMTRYGVHATPGELDDYAYIVFTYCHDMTCVTDALEWSKRSFQDKPNPMYMDTYANILYKMGKKDEAIVWEQKAIDLSAEDAKPRLQATLEKIKKGEKTWN